MNVEIEVRSTQMAYEKEFRQLNEAWITKYFELEESDIQTLNDPQKQILDKGGSVFFALLDGKPVGCCALIVHDVFNCELAKMAVDPEVRGRDIGFLLGTALIAKAREKGFLRIFLDGNDKLTPSMALYRKLGFEEIPLINQYMKPSAYSRCNIRMALMLNNYNQPDYYI